jgi:RNA polymerase sigma-B factor
MTAMPDRHTLTLPSEPESAIEARRFLRGQTTLDSIRHSEADLLVTELIANVIDHSPEADEITVSVGVDSARDLVVTVSHKHPRDLDDPSPGAGFTLLDRISKSWGHKHSDGILSIWFTVRTPGTTAIAEDIEDDELFERMEDDPAAYSDELVRRHSDLAESISRRYRGKGVDEEDLLQVAHMALLKAIQRYDPTAGNIRPYAAATISGEMKKMLRDRGWSVRVPRSLQERSLEVANAAEQMSQRLGRPPELHELAAKLDMSENEVDEALKARRAYISNSMDKRSDETGRRLLDRLEDEDFHLSSAEDRVVVESAIRQLPERKQRILHLRFNEDMTQSDIAAEIGISQMHVSRLLRAAIEELQEIIETGSEPG